MLTNQLKTPYRTRIAARQQAFVSARADMVRAADLRQARRQGYAPTVMAVRCACNTAFNTDGGLDRYGHLTLGGIYQATPWRNIDGEMGLIVRTDNGGHSWFPARLFRPINARHAHLWPNLS